MKFSNNRRKRVNLTIQVVLVEPKLSGEFNGITETKRARRDRELDSEIAIKTWGRQDGV